MTFKSELKTKVQALMQSTPNKDVLKSIKPFAVDPDTKVAETDLNDDLKAKLKSAGTLSDSYISSLADNETFNRTVKDLADESITTTVKDFAVRVDVKVAESDLDDAVVAKLNAGSVSTDGVSDALRDAFSDNKKVENIASGLSGNSKTFYTNSGLEREVENTIDNKVKDFARTELRLKISEVDLDNMTQEKLRKVDDFEPKIKNFDSNVDNRILLKVKSFAREDGNIKIGEFDLDDLLQEKLRKVNDIRTKSESIGYADLDLETTQKLDDIANLVSGLNAVKLFARDASTKVAESDLAPEVVAKLNKTGSSSGADLSGVLKRTGSNGEVAQYTTAKVVADTESRTIDLNKDSPDVIVWKGAGKCDLNLKAAGANEVAIKTVCFVIGDTPLNLTIHNDSTLNVTGALDTSAFGANKVWRIVVHFINGGLYLTPL